MGTSEIGPVGLSGRLFVVAGGAGVAGETVVAALLRRGARVAVPSRSVHRLDRLRAANESPGLYTFPGDLATLAGAERVRDDIAGQLGMPDGMVAALGAWYQGERLVDLPATTWQRIMDDNLTSHFIAARAFLPVLRDRPGAVYVSLNGIAGVEPVPESGGISVTGAAQAMMMRVLAVELAGAPVRIHQVGVLTPIVTRHWEGEPPRPDWLTGEQVGDYVAGVLAPDFGRGSDLFLSIPA